MTDGPLKSKNVNWRKIHEYRNIPCIWWSVARARCGQFETLLRKRFLKESLKPAFIQNHLLFPRTSSCSAFFPASIQDTMSPPTLSILQRLWSYSACLLPCPSKSCQSPQTLPLPFPGATSAAQFRLSALFPSNVWFGISLKLTENWQE